VYKNTKLKNGQGPTNGCRAIDGRMNIGTVKEFSISEVNKDELSASGLGCFIFGNRVAGVHWEGGFICPRAGLNVVENIRMSELTENQTHISLPFRLCSLVTV
jgi:hypothetical protein